LGPFASNPRLRAIAALAVGAVSAFAFQPVGLWPLMPLALAVLCELVWQAKSLRGALLVGWLFGLGQFVIGLNWIATAFTYQAAMPAWLGWIAVVLLSLYLALYPALATGLAWRFKATRPAALVITLAGAWPVTEWLRGTIFTGFPWNPLGVTLADTPWLKVSTLIGTYGLGALVVLAAGAAWLALRRRWQGAAVIAAVLGLSLLWPQPMVPPPESRNLTTLPNPLPKRPFRGDYVRVVQPNIGQDVRWQSSFADEGLRRLLALSMKPGGQRPRLLLWPESAVTEPLEDSRPAAAPYAQAVRTQAAALIGPDEYLLAGGLAVFSQDERTISGAANSIFVLGQGGRELGRYDKAHLVPYGEYLPMRPLLSAIGLSRLAPGDMDFASGPGPRTIALPGWGKVGFQLCYEMIFSGEVVDRRNRPDFIFNPSNDSWFGRWGPPQHLAQAQLRAAEEGLPVIRSTPTGISAVIDAHGRIVQALPWHTAGVIDTVMPNAAPSPTLFARFGNLIPLLLAFALLLTGIVLGRTRR
jgi:apolipoprotein N-acyltransferase